MSDTTRTAILAGLFGLIGTIAGAGVTGWSELQLARQKFNSDLVMKALESSSATERLESLKLLVETNLIKDKEIQSGVRSYAAARSSNPESVPQIRSGLAATDVPSPNFSIRDTPRKISLIVISDTNSPSLESVTSVVTSRDIKASYHYLIGTDGSLVRFVDESNVAWHTSGTWKELGRINDISVGIGLVHINKAAGNMFSNLPPDHPSLRSSYTPAQLITLENLLVDLSRRYCIEPNSIITKQEAQPDRKVSDLFGSPMDTIRSKVRNKLDSLSSNCGAKSG